MNRSLWRYLPPILILGVGMGMIAFFLIRNRVLPAVSQPAAFPTLSLADAPARTIIPILPPTETFAPEMAIIPTDLPLPVDTATHTLTSEPARARPQTPRSESIVPTETPDVPITVTVEPEAGATLSPTLVVISAEPTLTPTQRITPTVVITATETPASIGTWTPAPTNTPLPTWTIVPPSAETLDSTPTPEVQAASTATPDLPTLTPLPLPDSDWELSSRQRFGVAGSADDAQRARVAGLNYGSYINWGVVDRASLPADTLAWQMIRVGEDGPRNGFDSVERAVAANPGATWVIGNEPDVAIQDNLPPATYAVAYHDLYYFIKERDPEAKIAIAGLASPTPLRRFYLDIMLDYYAERYEEQMPIDVWTVHVYVLREERGSWGIGIPTGLGGVDQGLLYEIDDHKRADVANQLVSDFRWWMRERGYQKTPLAITEFGILLPADYGFEPDAVSAYMENVVNFYLNATGPTGFPGDGDRLVQQWFWFSLHDATDEFSVSDLLDDNGQLTQIGRTYAEYVR